MKFHLLLTASLPAAVLASSLAYSPPAALVAQAKQSGCTLPGTFSVKDFEPEWKNSTSLSSFAFTFVDAATNASTSCVYKAKAKVAKVAKVAKAANGTATRHACESKKVAFIWDDETKDLSVIEQVCSSAVGQPEYEVSGTVPIETQRTSFVGTFSSINPIKHARLVRRHKRGVAWAYDMYN